MFLFRPSIDCCQRRRKYFKLPSLNYSPSRPRQLRRNAHLKARCQKRCGQSYVMLPLCQILVAEFVLQDYLFFICAGPDRCRGNTLCSGCNRNCLSTRKTTSRSRKFLTRTLTVTCNQPQASPSWTGCPPKGGIPWGFTPISGDGGFSRGLCPTNSPAPRSIPNPYPWSRSNLNPKSTLDAIPTPNPEPQPQHRPRRRSAV